MNAEPAFDAEWTASPPAPYPVSEDMPSWLKDPVPGSPGAGRWRQTAMLWGGSLLALAVVFAGAMWLFDEHKASSALQVVERSASVPAAPAPVAAPRKTDALPPLVLLTPAPPAAAPVHDVPPPVAAAPVKLAPRPTVPVLKPVLAKTAPLAPKARPLPVKKSPAVVKRPAQPVLAKLKPKPKAKVLARAAHPAPKVCEPGMLARECSDLH